MIAERLSCVSVSPYRRLSQTNCSLLCGASESSRMWSISLTKRKRFWGPRPCLQSPSTVYPGISTKARQESAWPENPGGAIGLSADPTASPGTEDSWYYCPYNSEGLSALLL